MANVAPKTYKNKKGETCEVGTNRVLRLNKDGSVNMVQFNKGNTSFAVKAKSGEAMDKMNVRRAELSPYTGVDSNKNWNELFIFLKEYPLALNKAVAKVGFDRNTAMGHIMKTPALKERYDNIMESELDNLEGNILEIAYETDPKYISTKLKANDTLLSARAKDRGYGHPRGFSIGAGGDVNIQIINNTGSSLPGQVEDGGTAEEV